MPDPSPAPAKPALHDRGGGLLYDEALGVTWLQDANYARSCGASPTGKMSWAQAQSWVGSLVYRDPVRGVDLSGWRLPKVRPIGESWNHQFRMDGQSDEGYNIRSPRSEFSHMYYVHLGLHGWWTPTGEHPETFGVRKHWTAMWSGEADVGPVKRLQSDRYWCHSPGEPFPSPAVWVFTTAEGNQRDGLARPNHLFVWPVRDGDVI